MNSRYFEWLSIVAVQRKEIATVGNWLQLALLAVVVLAIAAYVPGPRNVFQLRYLPAMLTLAPAVLLGSACAIAVQRDVLPLRAYGVMLLVSVTLLQVFASSLIAFSSAPGSFVFAAAFLVMASFYGFRIKATPRYWFAALPTAIAVVGAALLAPTPEHVSMLSVTGLLALGATLLLGSWGLDAHRAREQQESLRAALQARVLEDQARARDRLAEQLLRVLEHNHDASSALSGLLMNAQHIQEQTREGSLSPATVEELAVVSTSITKGLSRLRSLLEEARRESADQVDPPQPVRLDPMLGEALSDMRSAWPELRFEGPHFENSTERWRVRVTGGELALRRVVQNLLTNACQGDGVRAARNVWLRAYAGPEDGTLAIECRDDGPGFSKDLIELGPRAFQTTKPSGTGLGLYTAGSLVRASGGGLELANAPSGGAVVTVTLPAERSVL